MGKQKSNVKNEMAPQDRCNGSQYIIEETEQSWKELSIDAEMPWPNAHHQHSSSPGARDSTPFCYERAPTELTSECGWALMIRRVP